MLVGDLNSTLARLILSIPHVVAYASPPLSCRFHRALPPIDRHPAAKGAGLDS